MLKKKFSEPISRYWHDGSLKNHVKRMKSKTVYDDDNGGKNDKKKNNNGRLHE